MQIHTIRLSQETAFGQNTVEGGAIIATISVEHDFIDLSQLLAMVQYRQATIETTEIDDESPALHGDPKLDADESEDDSHAEESNEPEETETVAPMAVSVSTDLDSLESLGLDEGLVEAIKANKISTVTGLREFIDNGNDLVDLDKIGTVRAKKILAALESRG
jgi:hypothetical protein